MKTIYTQEQVDKVCELYESGTKVSEIASIAGVEQSSVTKIAKRCGLSLRLPRNVQKLVKCAYCGEKLTKGFRFCPYCGKDVRTRQDVLIEKLKDLLDVISLLPANCKDAARDTINSVISYIRDTK